jgi:hypothetical protein
MILRALDDNLQVRHIQGACEVTLPLLDPMNDYIQFFVERTSRGFRFSDYGLTIQFLADNDVHLETAKQAMIFDDILKLNGVTNSNDVLVAETTDDPVSFQKSLILYIKAITSILDMEHLRQPYSRVDFKSAVRQYIESREIEYEPYYQVETRLIGNVGVDFLVREKILIDALHSSVLGYADDVINRTFTDFGTIRRERPIEFKMAVVYDDESEIPKSRRFVLLNSVTDFPPIPWTKKDKGFDEILAH